MFLKLMNYFQNTSNRNVIASFGSFLNWVTGSSNSTSALEGSTQSIWVAYQILVTEQYNREIKTGLWREILRELSMQPKISLDTAVKVYISCYKVIRVKCFYLYLIFISESLCHSKNATIWSQWIIHISLVSTSSRYTYGSPYFTFVLAKFLCFISC